MSKVEPILTVLFYKTESGREPVREWLKSLRLEDKKEIGQDILLHGFVKKSQATPQADLELARERRGKYHGQ